MMKTIMVLILTAAVAASAQETNRVDKKPEDAGRGLRLMALTTLPEKIGFKPDREFPRVYGVLTDWNLGEQTASIFGLKDGTASLYTTSKFGIIGGQGHERVRKAAERYVATADKFYDSSSSTTNYPYPSPGMVNFYLLTYKGVRLLTIPAEDMNKRKGDAAILFDDAQRLLTELRLVTQEEQRKAQPGGETLRR